MSTNPKKNIQRNKQINKKMISSQKKSLDKRLSNDSNNYDVYDLITGKKIVKKDENKYVSKETISLKKEKINNSPSKRTYNSSRKKDRTHS